MFESTLIILLLIAASAFFATSEIALAAARRLTASTNRSPVPPRHRIRVAAALGSALSGSAALTADQGHALGAP